MSAAVAREPGEALRGVAAGHEPLQLADHVRREVPVGPAEPGQKQGQAAPHHLVEQIVDRPALFDRVPHHGAAMQGRCQRPERENAGNASA